MSASRYVGTIGHIIVTPSKPVFALIPECCLVSGEAMNINIIFFGLARPWVQLTLNRVR